MDHSIANSIKEDAQRLLADGEGAGPSTVKAAIGAGLQALAEYADGQWPQDAKDVRAVADGMLSVVAEAEELEQASFERIRQAEGSRDSATAALGQLAAALADSTSSHAVLSRIEALETQGANTQVKLDRLSAENASLRADNAEMRSALSKLGAENLALKAEVSRLLAFVDSLQQSLAGASAQPAGAE